LPDGTISACRAFDPLCEECLTTRLQPSAA
jgi:hypothetical protein